MISDPGKPIIAVERDFEEIINGFTSEFAVFESEEELLHFIKYYESLEKAQKANILNRINFETLNDKISTLFEQMNNFDKEEQFFELVSSSNGILTIKEDEISEKEVIRNKIYLHPIYPFLNKDFLVKVGNNYHKYFDNLLVKSESKEKLNLLNTSEKIINSSLQHLEVYEILNSHNQIIERWGEANLIRTWTEEKNKPYCKNDRRVRLEVGIIDVKNTFNDPIIGTTNQHTISRIAEVIPSRKGIPCIWYNYNTRIIWDNFDMTYETMENGDAVIVYNWIENDIDVEDNRVLRSDEIFAYTEEFGQLFDCQWTEIKSDISTRGIWDKWLNVDWQM